MEAGVDLGSFPSAVSDRMTVVAVAAFLDAFQKVADLATNSRGNLLPVGFHDQRCVCWGGGGLD